MRNGRFIYSLSAADSTRRKGTTSGQRPYSESYRLPFEEKSAGALEVQSAKKLLAREWAYPKFDVVESKPLSRETTVPVSDTEAATVRWGRKDGGISLEVRLPPGWRRE